VFEILSGSVIEGIPTIGGLILCTVCSLLFGFSIAGAYMYKNKYSTTMAVTLVILPAVVQVVIMLVNGNIGVGIAVAGAFSLIRFRSIPGTARDICCLFFAMALGFVCGMGYLFYAFVFFILIGSVVMILTHLQFGVQDREVRILRVTVPEGLDYNKLFDDLFKRYTQGAELDRVKTSNAGSLYELTYSIRVNSAFALKPFVDELRNRNGNLNVSLSRERPVRRKLL